MSVGLIDFSYNEPSYPVRRVVAIIAEQPKCPIVTDYQCVPPITPTSLVSLEDTSEDSLRTSFPPASGYSYNLYRRESYGPKVQEDKGIILIGVLAWNHPLQKYKYFLS